MEREEGLQTIWEILGNTVQTSNEVLSRYETCRKNRVKQWGQTNKVNHEEAG